MGMKAFEVKKLVVLNSSIILDQEWALLNAETKLFISPEDCPRLLEFDVKMEGATLVISHRLQKEPLRINVKNHPKNHEKKEILYALKYKPDDKFSKIGYVEKGDSAAWFKKVIDLDVVLVRSISKDNYTAGDTRIDEEGNFLGNFQSIYSYGETDNIKV